MLMRLNARKLNRNKIVAIAIALKQLNKRMYIREQTFDRDHLEDYRGIGSIVMIDRFRAVPGSDRADLEILETTA